MDDESKPKKFLVWGAGALGLGAVASAVALPKIGIWVALAIILFAIILFGCYFLYQRARKQKKSKDFEGAIEAQTAASPRAISDPNRRAALDKLRQKFQKGLQEFKSRGKDIYKLPWYVIIGEPGSGKTEAIRHSGIDFPPGMQDELQGSGGTVNMDWWFTNRSIILDTAGSMIFNEADGEMPEWVEFLKLLRKARPHSPINGLFLVLSVESLIKDSSDKIASKASRLSQRLETIKKILDVRFPVYLLVTKCDLLTGFREFFDNIEDPLLQHQIFGWSNPDPLDTPFKPELVEQHLKSVAERIRRRRLAMLREEAVSARFGDTQFFVSPVQQSGATGKRRLDYVDSSFALPESVMRLAPRLRRYLETVFVEGEWSAKPVFLRGIYFTSSMREGRALDEAMALATGVPLDQLPSDRDWDKNRSYFMRDLFLEKVFRESGLVTRATNTLTLLRQRQILIMGVTVGILLLLLFLSLLSYRSLRNSVLAESKQWKIGANNWNNNGEWASPIVQPGTDNPYVYAYEGQAIVPNSGGQTVIEYQKNLKQLVERRLHISWVFRPMAWILSGKDLNRKKAQEAIFASGVLKPLVTGTQSKMAHVDLSLDDAKSIERYREALLSLVRLQADNVAGGGSMNGSNPQEAAARYLNSFLSYVTDSNQVADPELVSIFQWDYGQAKRGEWPPSVLVPPNSGDSLANNPAIQKGLNVLNQANKSTQKSIADEVGILNNFVDTLYDYEEKETEWLASQSASTAEIEDGGALNAAKGRVNDCILQLEVQTNFTDLPLTNLQTHYSILRNAAENASSGAFREIRESIPQSSITAGLFGEIFAQLDRFRSAAATPIIVSLGEKRDEIMPLDRDQMIWLSYDNNIAHQVRWSLYTNACALADENIPVTDDAIGDQWQRFSKFKTSSDAFDNQLALYTGPLKDQVLATCHHIADNAVQSIRGRYLNDYASLAASKVNEEFDFKSWTPNNAQISSDTLDRIDRDLKSARDKLSDQEMQKLQPIGDALVHGMADLQQKIGFPIFLNDNPDQPMEAEYLASLKKMINPLTAAIGSPAWRGLLNDSAQERADESLSNCKKYNEVLAALVNDDGSSAGVKVYFVPSESDTSIINIFRAARVAMGDNNSGWVDLSQHTTEGPYLLAQGTVADGLKISFRRLISDQTHEIPSVSRPDWGLVSLILSGQAHRTEDGADWILRLALNDGQGDSGTITFRITPEHTLPKAEDWPKR